LPPGLSQPFALLHVAQFDGLFDAVNRYAERCAREAGFTVPAAPASSLATGLIVTLADFGYLSEAEARQRGVHPGPAVSHDAQSRPSEAANDAVTACVGQAEHKLGSTYARVRDQFLSVENQLSEAFHAAMEPKIVAADAAEARCVVNGGWQPALPDEVGSEDVSIAEVFGVPPGRTVDDASTGTQTYLPSPREVDLALALLHCRRTLDSPAQLLAAAKAAQLPIVGRYEQQILQLDGDIDGLARKAASVLQ
jgi:hypothetical protein